MIKIGTTSLLAASAVLALSTGGAAAGDWYGSIGGSLILPSSIVGLRLRRGCVSLRCRRRWRARGVLTALTTRNDEYK